MFTNPRVLVQLKYPFFRQPLLLPAVPRVGELIEATKQMVQEIPNCAEDTKFKVDQVLYTEYYDYPVLAISPVGGPL